MGASANPLTRRTIDSIVGISPWTKRLHAEILGLARYCSNVLITGPSGTGKELIARAIHAHSDRAERPFIPVDCASITGTLFASHMFGHLKGAFTGARYTAMGCFRAADGGTIFLDEIGELEFDLQAKLLRVLQERTVIPVGSHDEISVDVRVIAATNRDLAKAVEARQFREDLYYRVNVVSLETVPLRLRLEDIEILSHHILAKLAIRHGMPLKRVSPEALRLMRAHSWPGNVRELENALERAVLFSQSELIGPEALAHLAVRQSPAPVYQHLRSSPPAMKYTRPAPWDDGPLPTEPRTLEAIHPEPVASSDDEHWLTMAEFEREHIRMTLEYTYYNQSAAARLLEMDRNLLRRKIKKYNLDTTRSRPGRPLEHNPC